MIVVLLVLGVSVFTQEVELSVTGVIVNVEPTIGITNNEWTMIGMSTTGDLGVTPKIALQMDKALIESGTKINIVIVTDASKLYGVKKLTVEETSLGISKTEIPIGGTFKFPKAIDPKESGVEINPKFIISADGVSLGDIADGIDIQAMYY